VLAGACVFQEAKRRCARLRRDHTREIQRLLKLTDTGRLIFIPSAFYALSFPIQLTFHRINTGLRVCLWSVGGGAKMEMGKRRAENITYSSRGIICEWRRGLSSMQHLTSCKRSSESAVEFLIAFFCSFRRLSLIFLHVAFVLPALFMAVNSRVLLDCGIYSKRASINVLFVKKTFKCAGLHK
jgi:hypothetical protein